MQDIPKGVEVFNTYGEVVNADLVFKYGFALADNPFDCIRVMAEQLQGAAESVLGKRAARSRLRFLRSNTSVLDPETDDDMEMGHGSRLNAPLAAALLVLGAPAAAFDSWTGMGDALRHCLAHDVGLEGAPILDCSNA